MATKHPRQPGPQPGVAPKQRTERDAESAHPMPVPSECVRPPGNCRAREILTRVGDKWSVHIIAVLGAGGTLRFGEIRRRVDGISQRMLTVTLRGLERDGLVIRTMYPELPPRVEYTLTPLGATLRNLVCELIRWSETHLDEVDAARARYDDPENGRSKDQVRPDGTHPYDESRPLRF